MNLYLLKQKINTLYETYDSCVVVAKTKEQAKKINPAHTITELDEMSELRWSCRYDAWASPSKIKATYLGLASPTLMEGEVICASFNAG